MLKDLFGEDEPKTKGGSKFFRIAKSDIGTRIESLELVNMACPNCKATILPASETEMDYLEETERQLVRLVIDELEGRE